MSDGVSVAVRGKDKLLAKLNGAAPGLYEAIERVAKVSAEEMAATAQKYAPVRTGALRRSIVVTPPGGRPPSYSQGAGHGTVPRGAYMVSAGNDGVRTAHLVEFGTAPHPNAGRFAGTMHPGTRPRPFFWSAFRLVRRKLRARVARAIREALKKASGA